MSAAILAGVLVTGSAESARADPAPGFAFDPVKLEARMDDCMAYRIGEQEVLMGWVSLRTGQVRNWRCSSLRHMILDRGRPPHDPHVHVPDFMRCADKVISYGFPRPGDPGNTDLIYQYDGTRNRAHTIVNDSTGDIVSIYTTMSNDWTGCARGL